MHCNVISALRDTNLVFVVTEPTPFGKHDANLALHLCKVLGLKAFLVLNKADVGNKALIEELAQEHSIEIVAEIPYKREFVVTYSKGEAIMHESIARLADFVEEMHAKTLQELRGENG